MALVNAICNRNHYARLRLVATPLLAAALVQMPALVERLLRSPRASHARHPQANLAVVRDAWEQALPTQ